MQETLAHAAFAALDKDQFVNLSPKGRLEAFAWEYCRSVSEAPEAAVAAEAAALGLPVERLHALRDYVTADRAQILAEVLRIVGDRSQANDGDNGIDKLLDDVLGTSGREGTIPG